MGARAFLPQYNTTGMPVIIGAMAGVGVVPEMQYPRILIGIP
jgi:hypothetical protein